MMVLFYYRPTESGKDESGLPVFTDTVFVQITMDPQTTVDRKADEEDIERFPDHYSHFVKSTARYEPIKDQIPLEMWPMASPGEIATLKARDIRTVEQLSTVKKELLDKWPPRMGVLVDLAKTYMKTAGSGAKATLELEKATAENVELREQIVALKAEIRLIREQSKKVEDA